MPSINQYVRLAIREKNSPDLSFCSAKPKALQAWVDDLRLTNIGKTSKQLHQSIIEVQTLKITAENRFQLLEILRKPILNICETLSGNYLGQALVLSGKTMNAAQLAQALQSELASAYECVVIETKDTRTGLTRKTPQYTITALSRCMGQLLRLQIRCHQLYSSLPDQFWIKINTLYLIGEQLCCLSNQLPTSDYDELSPITLADLYKTSLLIEASKPEQLRQQELSALTKVIPIWAQKVDLTPYSPERTQSFSVDIYADHPPQYHQLLEDIGLDRIRVLDTTELVGTLREFIHKHSIKDATAEQDQNFPVPNQFGPDLLNKLANSWGERNKRQLQRTDTRQGILACTGLTSIHYFASGSIDFASLIKTDKSDPFGVEGGELNLGTSFSNTLTIETEDVWGKAFTIGMKEEPEAETKHQRVEHSKTKEFKLETINASAGGYCLRWDPEVTEKIQAGDLIGLQPDSSKPWGIGVVRWIRQDQTGLFNIGVESISAAIRCCAIKATGLTDVGAEPVRALLIPGSKKTGRQPTIITPHRPFQAGGKAKIILDKQIIQIRLKQSIASSYAYNQFTYMILEENKRPEHKRPVTTTPKKSDIESLYNNL
ncbi:MAG: hypothetical protein KUG72_08830 [Pseudomonadales bacterium]|nr:hypothetical protein [Pseudomonadales bacterium]